MVDTKKLFGGIPETVAAHKSIPEWVADCASRPLAADLDRRQAGAGRPETHRGSRRRAQQKGYIVLSEAERAKGFVRPVRRTYVHEKCGGATTMGHALAETYARDPAFYSGTFCVGCGKHFPVGADGEFVWDDGSKVGT